MNEVLIEQPTLETLDLDLVEVMLDLDPGMLVWSATESGGSTTSSRT